MSDNIETHNERELIEFKFNVEWKIYDITGEVSRGSKPFETKPEAEAFALKKKRETPKNLNLVLVIRELTNNEIIGRYKKKEGNKNFRREKRR